MDFNCSLFMHYSVDIPDLAYWINFFKNVSLPSATGKQYANLFLENRMSVKLLRYLDKDLLKEMGIIAVGDIIAILQHCKTIDFDKEEADMKKITCTAVSSTTPDTEKPNIPPGHELPVPAKRRVPKEHEGAYKVKLPSGTTEKTKKILQQMKSARSLGPQPTEQTTTTRVVIMKAAPSLSSSPPTRLPKPQVESDSDSDENFEVTISSSGTNAQTASLGQQHNPSVFNRLGAQIKQPKIAQSSISRNLPKSVMSNIINRTLANQAAENRKKMASQERVRREGLKRTASDSVFSRLGNGSDNFYSDDQSDSLEYRGVFKQPRLSAPLSNPNNSPRISAKDRLGGQKSSTSAAGRLSAGILTRVTPVHPKRVHDRLG